MKNCKAILVGNGTMGARHKARYEACGVNFIAVADNAGEFDRIVNGVALSDVDFAVIASPATTHYDYAKYFLEHRIPVFIEKPLALNGADAQELVDLSVKNATTLFVAQSECYNPIFLNFRKHFFAELRALCGACEKKERPFDVHLEFRREHRYSERCRDVNVSLDLLVHDLSLFFTLFKYGDVDIVNFEPVGVAGKECYDAAILRLVVARGPYRGVSADFFVNRDSDRDVRTISVDFGRSAEKPHSDYTVSLARYTADGEIAHIPDSLDNEHRFFVKILAGACADLSRRAAQNAADCVKVAGE